MGLGENLDMGKRVGSIRFGFKSFGIGSNWG